MTDFDLMFLNGVFPDERSAHELQAQIDRVGVSIAACRERIEERCVELGIPMADSRVRAATYRADMAASALRRWPDGEEWSLLHYVKGVRRDLLLRELALRGETYVPHEDGVEIIERVDRHVDMGAKSVLPMAAHVSVMLGMPLYPPSKDPASSNG